MLCAVPSRLPKMRGDINVKDAGREASCSSDTSPRRAGDRSAVLSVFFCPARACVCSRLRLSVRTSRHRCGEKARDPDLQGRETGELPAHSLLVSYRTLASCGRRAC